MNPTTATHHDAPHQSWWTRLTDRCYRATTPRLVQDIQHEASNTYSQMLEDLSTPLERGFEKEMARQLQRGQPPRLRAGEDPDAGHDAALRAAECRVGRRAGL